MNDKQKLAAISHLIPEFKHRITDQKHTMDLIRESLDIEDARLADMEVMLVAMAKLANPDYVEPVPKPKPAMTILHLDKFTYPAAKEKGVVDSVMLHGLNTNNFYVEFEVDKIPFDNGIIIPFFTITNKNLVGKVKPNLNGGRIAFTIFGAGRPSPYPGMINLFWASDREENSRITPGDKTAFKEWRTSTNADWTKKHKIRVDFRKSGHRIVTAHLFLDDKEIASRMAAFHSTNPELVFPSYYFSKGKWINPTGMVITNLTVANLPEE